MFSLTQGLRRAVQTKPNGTATSFAGRHRTWQQCFERIGRVAGALSALGVKRGDRVAILALNSDRSVRLLKGEGRPVLSQSERAEVMAALEAVDFVTIFDEETPRRLIATLLPDVLVKGGDWAVDRIVGREIVEARGGVVRTIPLVPGVSTTALIQRIRSTSA